MHDTAAPAPHVDAPVTSVTGKTIVLFSDGTGNSSAKLFKTNVWRMYEAVDLGPAAPDRRPQISYYDDGVGTSAFKPLAVLGGVFGYGLKRNVLDIYKYACRNYEKGDEIYAFGFSRGAFTTRLVVGLIAHQGLVQSNDEGELDRLSRQAYREFRRGWLPRYLKSPTRAIRRVRDIALRRRDKWLALRCYKRRHNARPTIRFVGVWDTVSAYGGPFAELTRAIDNWIFPLSMPDYRLNVRVECARHALALDDERDAFQPLLWDELHEDRVARHLPARKNRLQQVWFTGMHSDVGGGYPDESLSYVSLLWMMEEAETLGVRPRPGIEKQGVRTLAVIKDRFIALASSAGPIHDSRKGIAAYYRYQPRRIAAWLHPVTPQTLGLRDPEITGPGGAPQGLLRNVKIHQSVVARIAHGTDRYAPITLPPQLEVYPPQIEGEDAPQADSVDGAPRGPHTPPVAAPAPPPMVSPELRARLAATQADRVAAFEGVYDLVWRRRVTYFVTMGFTLLLATLPLWVTYAPDPIWLADGRTWIDAPLHAVGMLLPSMFAYWVNTFADNPFYFLVLALCIGLALRYGARCERRLRDRARHIWRASTTSAPLTEPTTQSRLARVRNSAPYQHTVQVFKWGVLPALFLVLILIVAAWLGAAGVTQTALPWLEASTALCRSAGGALPPLVRHDTVFRTDATCLAVGATVTGGRRYRVELQVQEPWFDGSHATTPLGLRARDMGFVGVAGAPFRRVVEANYLQPVVEIRRPPESWRVDSLFITALPLTQEGPLLYSAVFTADHDGELFVFANDAVSLLRPAFFYQSPPGRNHGTAALLIFRLEDAPVAKGPQAEPTPPEALRRVGRTVPST